LVSVSLFVMFPHVPPSCLCFSAFSTFLRIQPFNPLTRISPSRKIRSLRGSVAGRDELARWPEKKIIIDLTAMVQCVITLSERKLGFHFVQWISDNFEWKKIRFSLKTQRSYVVCSYVVSKNAHNTRRTLLCSVARSAYDFAWLRLQLSHATVALLLHTATASTPPLRSKKRHGSARKPAGQSACGAGHENQPAFYEPK